PRQLPRARLDDDVDGSALELREPELESDPIEVLPAVSRLERGHLFADPAVPCDQPETELPEVPRFDLPHLARHEVVVEELHTGRLEERRVATSTLSVT